MIPPIALFHPVVTDEAIEASGRVLRSGWIGPGPVVDEFEAAFAAEVEATHAVAVSSGTAALLLSLRLLDLTRGDEVIVSPITFAGANEVVLELGCVPIFADVDPDTGLLDPEAVAAAIGPRTAAIVVTHLGGRPVDLPAFERLAHRHDLALIEDAAHACGSRLRGRPIGSHGNTQAFSFQATKNLNAVDGGMLCVRDAADAERARRLRWMGIDRSTWQRSNSSCYRWQYDIAEPGHKCAMNDLNAAIALAHLPALAAGNERRRTIFERYAAGLADVPGVHAVRSEPDTCSASYLATFLVDDRDLLLAAFAEDAITAGVHYQRNDAHTIFGPCGDLPGAERYWTRTISLPCHLALTDDEVDRVIGSLQRWSQTPRRG
jgi:perosamine synthetase